MTTDVIARARRALAAAVDFAVRSQDSGGFWEGTPDPRIFDTAVVAHALRGDQSSGPRARAWLATAAVQTHHPVAAATERWLRQLALDARNAGPPPLSLTGAHFRRAVLVHGLAVSAGLPDADPRALLDAVLAAGRAVGDRQVKQWHRVTLAAADIVARVALRSAVPSPRVAELVGEQRAGGSFCLMPAVTALAYLALRHTDDGRPAAVAARGWLSRAQCHDGTWRFVSNDIWDTALMVCAVRGCPAFDRHALGPAVDFLAHAQSADGGWSYKRGLESDPDTTGMTLQALACTAQGRRVRRAAHAFAARTRLADGRWPSWQSADDHAAPDVTANMVAGLNAHPATPVDVSSAIRWLVSLGHEGWRAEWYAPRAYAVREIAAAVGWEHPAGRQAARSLLAQQNDDGGWPTGPDHHPSGPAATGLAVSVLANTRTAVPGTALAYLIDTQLPDGSWPGVPIMYGPRPFLVHFGTHTHAFAAAGLRDLLNAVDPASSGRTPDRAAQHA